MKYLEAIRISFRSLGANKLRAGLTMLGIIIGVGAVIALLAVGEGASAAITQQVQGIGSNLLIVFPGSFSQGRVRTTSGSAVTLSYDDAKALENSVALPDVKGVAPVFNGGGQVVFQGNNTSTTVAGVTPSFQTVRNWYVRYGRFVEERDLETSTRVAVLGTDVVKNLFGTQDPIGKLIKINRVPFTVVGIMQEKGAPGFGGMSQDDIILVPITTAHARLFGSSSSTPTGQHRVSTVYVSALGESRIDAAASEITQVLRDRHKVKFQQDDFSVLSQKDLLGALSQITSVLTIFLAAIAAISLLVGGIGIMNIMLVSVTERTREIGIRKAVGAKRRDILAQFLTEAIAMSVTGGMIGILLGAGIAQLVNLSGVIQTVISTQSVMLSVGFALAIGLFFGLYPAWRASALHPIDALRYE